MTPYIPCINSSRDFGLVKELFMDAAMVRVSLSAGDEFLKAVPADLGRWVDGGVDTFHKWPPHSESVKKRLLKIDGASQIGERTFQQNPQSAVVAAFVQNLLNACIEFQPRWLSVPQLPFDVDKSRSTLNRQLAAATGRWADESHFAGKLILPVILIHHQQTDFKSERTRIVSLAAKNYEKSRANGAWVVDASLNDQSGFSTLGKRFSRLVDLHRELQAALPPSAIIVAGPYWGMNLVLWARGFITHPVIGIGSAFQYSIPGGVMNPGSPRVALPPLRRQAKVSRQLEGWLGKAAQVLPKGSEERAVLESLARRWPVLGDPDHARKQVATFYGDWVKQLHAVGEAGRALALYQDLSKAYVTGRMLFESVGSIPKPETTANPSGVAQQLMLSCL